jgi:hypothetical protein
MGKIFSLCFMPAYPRQCAMRSAILMMSLFIDNFFSPYLPIPSSPHLRFNGMGELFRDDTEVFNN